MVTLAPDRVRILWWIKIYLVCGVLAVPVAVNGLIRYTQHDVPMPTLPVVGHTLAYLIVGPAIAETWAWPLAMMIGTLALVGFIGSSAIRLLLIGFVLTPVGLAIILSYALHSMWVDRLFFFATPFLALAAAAGLCIIAKALDNGLGRLASKIAVALLAGVLTAGLCAASLRASQYEQKPTNYRAAAEEIRSGLKPGDVIFVPEAESFWGIAWYLAGPDWGSPLAVQDQSDFSEKWTTILERLGPLWRARLHLEPRTRFIFYDHSTMVVGLNIPPIVANAKRVWLVNETNNRHSPVNLTDFSERERRDYRGLTVQMLEH
jgi:hypothetical protein